MLMNRFKYFQILLLFSLSIFVGCNFTEIKEQNLTKVKTDNIMDDSSKVIEGVSTLNNIPKINTFEIIVVQCANGYEYEMHNYDFNPVIEIELNKFENINVKAFPYKSLMGVPYQGVFDKKYYSLIIKKVDVDFLILTRFDKGYNEFKSLEMKWGYELKIVNTKTLKQLNSINAHDLKDYKDVVKHI